MAWLARLQANALDTTQEPPPAQAVVGRFKASQEILKRKNMQIVQQYLNQSSREKEITEPNGQVFKAAFHLPEQKYPVSI